MLNIYEANDDLVEKHVELEILLKAISFLVVQKFNGVSTKVLKFSFECYPEPKSSQQFTCANPRRVSSFLLLFDYTWHLYSSSPPLSEPSQHDSEPWFPTTWLRIHTYLTQHSRKNSSGSVISPTQRPVPENTAFTKDKYPCPSGIGTHNPSERAATDQSFRPRGHWH